MNTFSFKFREHPGDLLRNTDVIQLPNPNENLEEFLVWFLPNYQSSDNVAYLGDLYKLVHDEFFDGDEKEEFVLMIGKKTKQELKEEIKTVKNDLKNEAYKNFYTLILTNKIELITDGKKH